MLAIRRWLTPSTSLSSSKSLDALRKLLLTPMQKAKAWETLELNRMRVFAEKQTRQEVLQRVRLSRLDVAVRGCGGRGLLCKFN